MHCDDWKNNQSKFLHSWKTPYKSICAFPFLLQHIAEFLPNVINTYIIVSIASVLNVVVHKLEKPEDNFNDEVKKAGKTKPNAIGPQFPCPSKSNNKQDWSGLIRYQNQQDTFLFFLPHSQETTYLWETKKKVL